MCLKGCERRSRAEFATRALEVTISHLVILLISKSPSRGDVHDGNTVNVSSPTWEAACAERRRVLVVLVDCRSLHIVETLYGNQETTG